jgi:hypothetical protein
MEIALATDPKESKVTSATFSITFPGTKTHKHLFTFPPGPSPPAALCAIHGFQVDLVGGSGRGTQPRSGLLTPSATRKRRPLGAVLELNRSRHPHSGDQGPPVGTHTCTFTSGAGNLTYAVSAGTLAVATKTPACPNPDLPPGQLQRITAEKSNATYSAPSPPSGPTVSQSLFT